ncbi:MAG: hypothetical protein AB4911_01255 [Oscillochloridaceae bacterium umkhey_bin13]
METLAFVVRYGFVLALVIEAVVLGRAMFGLLRAKAGTPAPVTAPVEE